MIFIYTLPFIQRQIKPTTAAFCFTVIHYILPVLYAKMQTAILCYLYLTNYHFLRPIYLTPLTVANFLIILCSLTKRFLKLQTEAKKQLHFDSSKAFFTMLNRRFVWVGHVLIWIKAWLERQDAKIKQLLKNWLRITLPVASTDVSLASTNVIYDSRQQSLIRHCQHTWSNYCCRCFYYHVI